MSRRAVAGENARGSTTVDRPTSAVVTVQVRPPTWFSGIALTYTSSGPADIRAACARPAPSRLACVSTAPFGRPVVPEVYRITAGSAGATAAARRSRSGPGSGASSSAEYGSPAPVPPR
jgi:hypothetical protein